MRVTLSSSLLISSLLSPALSHPSASVPTESCTNVHFITARASTELPGEGVLHTLRQLLVSKLPSSVSSSYEALSYPATLENYIPSSSAGTAAMKKRLVEYTSACPQTQLVLMGYSQGAHVIGDAVCGGGEGVLGDRSEPVSEDVVGHVKAIIQMGDPRFVPGASFDVGTAKVGGVSIFPFQKAT
jgi:acetylxylan esterase